MYPTIQRYVMKARVEDMHREASDDRLARAARHARRAHADHGTMWAPGRLATIVARMRAWSGAHKLWSASSQPEEQASGPAGFQNRDEIRAYQAAARTGADPVTEPFTDRVDAAVSATTVFRQE